jgi:hypothetical protein
LAIWFIGEPHLGPYTKLTNGLISGTAYDDATVDPGQTYYYVVVASDGNNSSDYSNEVLAAVPSHPRLDR